MRRPVRAGRHGVLRGVAGALCLAALAGVARAQATGADSAAAPAMDTMFARAQRLVGEGQGDAGRRLVDSLLAAAPPGSPRYAEALYWRATFATSAAAAERDYQRLAVEFPLSPRSEDALMRLAQMEIARGDREAALGHLQRLVLEHPNGASRPRASYWMGRVQLDLGDVTHACQSLAAAQAGAPPDAVELRNQIEFSARRCEGVAANPPTTAAESTTAPPPARTDSTMAPGRATGTTTTAGRPAPASAAASASPASGSASAKAPARPAPTAGAKTATTPAPKPAATAATSAPRAPSAAAAAPAEYTVQVAAFPAKSSATSLAAKLKAKGFPVRVAGTHAPYRVRVGRYKTHAAAEQMAQRLKAAGMEPWIAEAEPQ